MTGVNGKWAMVNDRWTLDIGHWVFEIIIIMCEHLIGHPRTSYIGKYSPLNSRAYIVAISPLYCRFQVSLLMNMCREIITPS